MGMELARRLTPRAALHLARYLRSKLELSFFRPRVVDRRWSSSQLKITIEDRVAAEWYDRHSLVVSEIAAINKAGLGDCDLVFDLGAHQGVIAMLLAKEVAPNGRVVAVE